jgi:FkbM family methyltransferase
MNYKSNIVNFLCKAAKRMPLSAGLQAICQSYTDRYEGNNNMTPSANGEEALLEWLGARSSVVFDVGANLGEWSKRLLSVNSKVHCHLFEPNPYCTSALENHFKSNARQVFLNYIALSNVSGEADLHSVDSSCQLSSLFFQDTAGLSRAGARTQRRVQTTTLDRYCAERKLDQIDFLKIDAEGSEIAVLEGARELLRRQSIRYAQLEYHATWIYSRSYLRDLFTLAQEVDYSVYKLISPNVFLSVRKYAQQLETFQYSNWVLCCRGESLPGKMIFRHLH